MVWTDRIRHAWSRPNRPHYLGLPGPAPLLPEGVYASPGGRRAVEAYPDVVVRLREVDERAELLYAGRGIWLLGAVWPHSSIRAGAAERIQEGMRSHFGGFDGAKDQWCRAVRGGWRQIGIYDEDDVATGWMVLDFQERDWNWRTRAEAAFEAGLRHSDGTVELEEHTALLMDKLESEYKDIHSYAFQRRRGFHQRVAADWMKASRFN